MLQVGMLDIKKSREFDGKLRVLFRKTCRRCLKEIWLPRHRATEQVFCSRQCHGRWVADGGVKACCAQCGRETIRARSKAKKSKHGLLFCSRACKETAQSLDGGVVKIQPPHYHSTTGLHSYRGRALKRREQRCEKCGYDDMPKMLDVHHRDGNRRNGAIDNLQVLCVWCHAIHTRKVEWHPRRCDGPLVQRENTGPANQE